MKGSDGVLSKCVDLNGTRVYFWDRLNFYVVSPFSIQLFSAHVVVELLSYVVLEKLLLQLDVAETIFPDFRVITIVAWDGSKSTIELMGDWSKKTVAIASDILHYPMFLIESFDKLGELFPERLWVTDKSILEAASDSSLLLFLALFLPFPYALDREPMVATWFLSFRSAQISYFLW